MRNLDFNRIVTLMVVVLLVFATSASAQERRPREDVEGLMEAYVISKLQEALQLSDDQFAGVVVAQKKLMTTRRNFRMDRNDALQRIRQALRGGRADELGSLLKQLDERQKQFESQQRADYQALDEILEIRQRARYRLLEQEVQRRFQQMVREIRGKSNPRRPDDP